MDGFLIKLAYSLKLNSPLAIAGGEFSLFYSFSKKEGEKP